MTRTRLAESIKSTDIDCAAEAFPANPDLYPSAEQIAAAEAHYRGDERPCFQDTVYGWGFVHGWCASRGLELPE